MELNFSKLKKYSGEIIYLFLIFFFCYTAFNKLYNIESFRTNLIKTSLFNIESAKYLSIIVISYEILIVLLLFFYKKIRFIIFCNYNFGFYNLYFLFKI